MERARIDFPVIVVTGARQTGKTTLLRHAVGAEADFVSLEDVDIRGAARSDPRAFLSARGNPTVLDEVQNAPDLLSYIQTDVDRSGGNGRWILSGSQSFALMQGVAQSLAGRAAVLRLPTFTAAEALDRRPLSTPEELLVGFYPVPRLRDSLDLRLWMASYVQTYLERDVRQVVQVGDLASFEQFVRLCAARTAGILNLASLARDAAVSPNTARRWISVLEASALFFQLRPYSASATRRMVKAPKLFALDTGLAAYLTGHRDSSVLWNGPLKGALFETAVLGEILKAFWNAGDLPPVFFWRASDGLEVDFVIEAAGRLHAVECKASATPMPAMADGLQKWRRIVGDAAGHSVLACDVESRRPVAAGVEAVPWREVGALALSWVEGCPK